MAYLRPPRAARAGARAALLAAVATAVAAAVATLRFAASEAGFVPSPCQLRGADEALAGPSRRSLATALLAAGGAAGASPGGAVWAFSPSDLGLSTGAASTISVKPLDPAKLQEALYLISRVQEATVQQERLISTGKFKDTQRNNIKKAINMMVDNYRLNDQVVLASGYVVNKENVVKASECGKDAIEALETAKEYFATTLKVTTLNPEQKQLLIDAMRTTRSKLDDFVAYMPEDVLAKARRRVEEENALNLQEFVGVDGGMINPSKLPWQK
mmetsp:Transcript_28659/g.72638  ORF Transcript_28659/g.72638 Transcript_28659/m.72638 type:complete len:272 (-) Transcript_28659:98-913(-)